MNAKEVAKKALDIALRKINKDEGDKEEKKIFFLGKIKAINLPASPSGSLALDLALGTGGYPEGRMIELFGPPSSGKTTLCLHAIAEAQKKGKYCAFIDIENTLDLNYARALGVNIDELILSQPDSGNQAMRIIDTLVRSRGVGLIIVDSVAALATEAEVESEIDKNHMGQQARLMSQALRILTVQCNKSSTTILFTNQIRMKIGVMWGSPETTPGGEALKFYASQRLDIRRKEPIKKGSETVGAKTRVKVVKNKVGPPFKEAMFNIMYGTGIDKDADIISVGEEVGLIERSGAWYSYNGEQIGQGLENSIEYFKERPELIQELREKVLSTVIDKSLPATTGEKDEQQEETTEDKPTKTGKRTKKTT